MSDLLFYKFNILAGVFISFTLALIAPALLARRQAAFIFSFSQISINVLLFSIIFHFNENKVLTAILGSLICYLLQKIANKVPAENESLVHTSIFVGLYSLNQILISRFPQLQAYSSLHNTGDLVTILDSDALLLSIISAVVSLLLLFFTKPILKLNFTYSTGLKFSANSAHGIILNFAILIVYYFMLSLSNLYFGFLFTVGSFFILSLYSSFVSSSLTSYKLTVISLLSLCIPSIFYISINTNTVTVPWLLLMYLVLFFIFKLLRYLRLNI